MRFSTVIMVFLCCLCGLQAMDKDFSGFKELPPTPRAQNLLRNPSFLEGDKDWVVRSGNGYEIGPFGPNIVPALRQKFVAGEEYNGLIVYQKISLKPKTVYRYGGLVKTEDLHRIKNGQKQARRPVIGVEWYYNGQWVNSFASSKGDKSGGTVDLEGKWDLLEYEFTTPDNPEYTYLFDMYASATGGEACWTNLYLEEALAHCIFFQVYPRFGVLSPANMQMEIGTSIEGEFKYPQKEAPRLFCRAEVVAEDGTKIRTELAPVQKERARFDLSGLGAGRYKLLLALADMANSYILCRGELQVSISDLAASEEPGVVLDDKGRFILNGKPFLPVAIYTWAIKEDQTREIKSLGFNSFVPYGALTSNPLKRPSWGVQSFRDSLDICSQNEIYVIPAISYLDVPENWAGISKSNYYDMLNLLISEFRTHPAVIAWYISDEPTPSSIPELEKLRAFVNAADPRHPTWIVFNNPSELTKYAMTTDIAAVDPYPLMAGKNRAEWEQYNVLDQTSTLQKLLGNLHGEGALWLVPQAFSWKIYSDTRSKTLKKDAPEVYDVDMPTGREILAMCLTGAIHGTKGFCFYEYQFWDAPKLYERFGPHLKYATSMLRANSDLILGTAKAPDVKVVNHKGTVIARAFRSDDGKNGIFVSALGPGESSAEISFPIEGVKLSSSNGNSKEIREGCWFFSGNGIDCDIIRD